MDYGSTIAPRSRLKGRKRAKTQSDTELECCCSNIQNDAEYSCCLVKASVDLRKCTGRIPKKAELVARAYFLWNSICEKRKWNYPYRIKKQLFLASLIVRFPPFFPTDGSSSLKETNSTLDQSEGRVTIILNGSDLRWLLLATGRKLTIMHS